MSKQNKHKLIDNREQIDGRQTEVGLEGWVKKVKGLRGTDGWLQNSHGDVKYSMGNIVDNTVITMPSDTGITGVVTL